MIKANLIFFYIAFPAPNNVLQPTGHATNRVPAICPAVDRECDAVGSSECAEVATSF
jgi:hypothetical protein